MSRLGWIALAASTAVVVAWVTWPRSPAPIRKLPAQGVELAELEPSVPTATDALMKGAAPAPAVQQATQTQQTGIELALMYL